MNAPIVVHDHRPILLCLYIIFKSEKLELQSPNLLYFPCQENEQIQRIIKIEKNWESSRSEVPNRRDLKKVQVGPRKNAV